MTDPPMVGDVALAVARRFRVPLVVISQDVFPEIAVELGRLRNPVLVAPARRAHPPLPPSRRRVVAIGETMKRRLEHEGCAVGARARDPNWVDTTAIVPQPRENPWAHEHGLDGRFVVMHSGNIGHAQDLDTLIRASASLGDSRSSPSSWSGSAPGTPTTSAGRELDAERVSFREYQPREHALRSRSPAPTSTSSGSAVASAGTSCPAGSTASSPPPAGDRRRRGRQRDRAARPRCRLWDRDPAGRTGCACADDSGSHFG